MSLRLLALSAYTLFLLIMATGPPVGISTTAAGVDLKLHHAGAFGLHTLLTWYWLLSRLQSRTALYGLSVVIPFLFGAIIEFVQWPLPYRSGHWYDLLDNLAGIGLALVLIAATRRYHPGLRGDGSSKRYSGPVNE